MNIGSRVISKKVGVPVVGTVVGIYDYNYFIHLQQIQCGTAQQAKYDFGDADNICVVLFDQPVRFHPQKGNSEYDRMEFLMQQPVSIYTFSDCELEELDDEKFKTQKTSCRMESE